MQRTTIVGWVLAAALLVAASQALAQQDEGPILRPKPKPAAKPTGATLLVLCDLACNWKLDGKERGHIAAGDSATSKVDLGEHIVDATTEDGLDKIRQLTEVKAVGQKIVILELQPVRDARLKAEQEARLKAEQETQDKAAREAARPTWTDPGTGLMWTKRDNGFDVNWPDAKDYCRSLQLSGYSDWHLPTLDELRGIYDPEVVDKSGRHAKGNLQLSGWQWSSSSDSITTRKAQGLGFDHGSQNSFAVGSSMFSRALCVRHPVE